MTKTRKERGRDNNDMKGARKRSLCLMIPMRFYVYIARKKNLLLDRSYSDIHDQIEMFQTRHL
jgi:hypothetical protein